MSSGNPQLQWTYSPLVGCHCWYDAIRREYILRGGQRIMATGQPLGGLAGESGTAALDDIPRLSYVPASLPPDVISADLAAVPRTMPPYTTQMEDFSEQTLATRIASLTLTPSITTNASPLRDVWRQATQFRSQAPSSRPSPGKENVSAAFQACPSDDHGALCLTGLGNSTEISYSAQPSSFFVVGRVFLCAEPEAARTPESALDGVWSLCSSIGHIHAKPRALVVIREGARSCSVLGLLAPKDHHSRSGVMEYGTVCVDGATPSNGIAESDARWNPVQIIRDQQVYTLRGGTRIDYGEVLTVGHASLVSSFGIVRPESMAVLLDHFQTVWVSRVGQRCSKGPLKQQDKGQAAGLTDRQSEAIRLHTIAQEVATRRRMLSRNGSPESMRKPTLEAGTTPGQSHEALDSAQKRNMTDFFDQAVRQLVERGLRPSDAVQRVRSNMLVELNNLGVAASSRRSSTSSPESLQLRAKAPVRNTISTQTGTSLQRDVEAFQHSTSAERSASSKASMRRRSPPPDQTLAPLRSKNEATTRFATMSVDNPAFSTQLRSTGCTGSAASLITQLVSRGLSVDSARVIASYVEDGMTLAEATQAFQKRTKSVVDWKATVR